MAPNEVKLLEGRRHRLVSGVNPCSVEVLSIKNAKGEEYKGGTKELDLKAATLSGKKVKLRYKVSGRLQQIRLWIEYEPSRVHDDFYFPLLPLKVPIVAFLVDYESKNPGEYEVEWDGRDETIDKRLLLAGKYKVKITGKCDLGKKESEAKLSVAKPNAFNYGIHYYRIKSRKKDLHSSKEAIEKVEQIQMSLKDGTGFTTESSVACTAIQALSEWKSASVVHWDGHSNPNEIWFHNSESKNCVDADRSLISSRRFKIRPEYEPRSESLDSVSKDELEDLFLVVLCGCNTANEIHILQMMLQNLDPGRIDGIHGPKTRHALHCFQRFNDIKPSDGLKNEETLKRLGVAVEKKTEEKKIREVQSKLRSFYPGSEKVYGRRTKKAVTNFQQVHDIKPADGNLNEKTLNRLLINKEDKTEKEINQEAQETLRSLYPGSLTGTLNSQTQDAIKNYQLISGIEITGKVNSDTIKELKIDEYAHTRAVQRKLKSYSYRVKLNGKLGERTRTAIRNYQRDHRSYYGPVKGLEVNGEADKPTFEALKIGPKEIFATNIASNINDCGSDIVVGFTYKIYFHTAKMWSEKFWEYLADGGYSIGKAARDAKHFVDVRMKNKLDYVIYNRSGESEEYITLHPARYGAKSSVPLSK